MIIWLSLLIPLVGAFIMLKWFQHRVKLWEVALPLVISIIFVFSFKSIVQSVQVSSKEWWGQLGVQAQYYEPWSTWVEETCTRSVPCGTDSKGNTTYCTETYDCSYCDDHSAKWYLLDDGGNKFPISEETYNALKSRWSATPQFNNMHRSISHHWSCGQDGNMYSINWNNQVLTSVPTVTQHHYENRVKCAVSSFNYPKINKSDKEVYGLYDYPNVNGYTQHSILGTQLFPWMSQSEVDTAETYAQYLCGYYGPRKQMKLWVLLFKDKPSIAADMQEAYWVGGNKNEVVVCIGLGSTREMQWVKAFSWTPNRTMLVNIREDLMAQKIYNFKDIYPILGRDLDKFERRHFKEFSYITVEPPDWATITTYIIVLVLTVFVYWLSVRTETRRQAVNEQLSRFRRY